MCVGLVPVPRSATQHPLVPERGQGRAGRARSSSSRLPERMLILIGSNANTTVLGPHPPAHSPSAHSRWAGGEGVSKGGGSLSQVPVPWDPGGQSSQGQQPKGLLFSGLGLPEPGQAHGSWRGGDASEQGAQLPEALGVWGARPAPQPQVSIIPVEAPPSSSGARRQVS